MPIFCLDFGGNHKVQTLVKVYSKVSEPESKLADFLKNNPKANVVMAGFTDYVGTEAYNLTLSKRRVGSVATYLEQQGVGADRMALLW